MRATFFISEGAKINDSIGPPDVRPPGYAPVTGKVLKWGGRRSCPLQFGGSGGPLGFLISASRVCDLLDTPLLWVGGAVPL